MAEGAAKGRGRGDWLATLPLKTVVFHRTVGLYRNLEETVFPERASPAGRENARARLCAALSDAAAASRRRFTTVDGGYATLCAGASDPRLSPSFQGLPVPPDPAAARWPEAVWGTIGGSVTAIVNAEDHLTLFDRSEAPFARQWRTLDAVADAVGASAPFAYSPDYGFLAALPDHVGSGLVLACDVSLFGLCVDRNLDPALRALDRLGFSTEPVFPSGAEEENPVDAPGCRYLVVAEHDVGDVRDVVGRMDAVCRELARQETNARLRLLDDGQPDLLDFIARSLATGANARTMGQGEAIDIAFAALFAADLGFLRLSRKQTDFLFTVPYLLSDERLAAGLERIRKGEAAAADEPPRVVRARLMRAAFRPLLEAFRKKA